MEGVFQNLKNAKYRKKTLFSLHQFHLLKLCLDTIIYNEYTVYKVNLFYVVLFVWIHKCLWKYEVGQIKGEFLHNSWFDQHQFSQKLFWWTIVFISSLKS